jgi:methylmalonyl-CoA/ethylmalonyl-CoA epimerase
MTDPAILGLAHVGIAVRSLDPAVAAWARLGFTLESTEILESMHLRIAFLRGGSSLLELLEPTSPESTVARFLERRGEGIHHISFLVSDIDAALRHASEAGLDLVDQTPRSGSHGTRIAFLHPRSLGGVLVEFCERRTP